MILSEKTWIITYSKAQLKRYCDTRGKQWTDESIELMIWKELMSYSLIKSYSSLNNTTISTREQYNDDMKGEIMAEDEYEYMKKLWDTFDIKSWGEYYELYNVLMWLSWLIHLNISKIPHSYHSMLIRYIISPLYRWPILSSWRSGWKVIMKSKHCK